MGLYFPYIPLISTQRSRQESVHFTPRFQAIVPPTGMKRYEYEEGSYSCNLPT